MAHLPVFLAGDNNYAPFVATTIASVCANTSAFVDFYVLDGGISAENQAKIAQQKFTDFSVEFISVNPAEVFKGFKVKNHLTISAFSRLLIPELVPQLDRVLYLDVDIAVLGDIAEMYMQHLEGFIIGAVWSEDTAKNSAARQNWINLKISESHRYFNSGVLLIDCKKWRNDKVIDKLRIIEAQYGNVRLHNDQDLLNKYFDNTYKPLLPRFNARNQMLSYLRQNDYDRYVELRNTMVIRHFESNIKPWHLDKRLSAEGIVDYENFDDFWRFAKMTAFYEELWRDYRKHREARLRKLLPQNNDAVAKPAPIIRVPSNKPRLLIFAHYNVAGNLSEYVLYALKHIRPLFTRMVFVSNSPLAPEDGEKLIKLVDAALARPNRGFAFGAYRDGLKAVGDLSAFDSVTLMNDQGLGPLFDLGTVYANYEERAVAFWGLTGAAGDDNAPAPVPAHLQSYFLCFRQNVVMSSAWRNFWARVADETTENDVFRKYETQLTGILMNVGFIGAAMCQIQLGNNAPNAEQLIHREVPFIKIAEFIATPAPENITNLITERSTYPVRFIREILTNDDGFWRRMEVTALKRSGYSVTPNADGGGALLSPAPD
jgi:lipopolysaccharide biosynthesis glycosyltransferase